MTPKQAMTSPLELMNPDELKFTIAFCDNEQRKFTEGPEIDKFETRMLAAERELKSRRY